MAPLFAEVLAERCASGRTITLHSRLRTGSYGAMLQRLLGSAALSDTNAMPILRSLFAGRSYSRSAWVAGNGGEGRRRGEGMGGREGEGGRD